MALARIAVLGAGTMGNGIAQVFAQHGHTVVLRDLDRAILERARTQIEKSLARLAEKGKTPPGEKDAVLARITLASRVRPRRGGGGRTRPPSRSRSSGPPPAGRRTSSGCTS